MILPWKPHCIKALEHADDQKLITSVPHRADNGAPPPDRTVPDRLRSARRNLDQPDFRSAAGTVSRRLERLSPDSLPLYGIPFAVKDNIDLAGIPTTAACPAYAYTPERSARVVELLVEAGAVPLGKTNMDQFATGLVGVRSPYGVTPNRLAPGYVAGGSSSGSAAALAHGLCSFSLGTDTARFRTDSGGVQ